MQFCICLFLILIIFGFLLNVSSVNINCSECLVYRCSLGEVQLHTIHKIKTRCILWLSNQSHIMIQLVTISAGVNVYFALAISFYTMPCKNQKCFHILWHHIHQFQCILIAFYAFSCFFVVHQKDCSVFISIHFVISLCLLPCPCTRKPPPTIILPPPCFYVRIVLKGSVLNETHTFKVKLWLRKKITRHCSGFTILFDGEIKNLLLSKTLLMQMFYSQVKFCLPLLKHCGYFTFDTFSRNFSRKMTWLELFLAW